MAQSKLKIAGWVLSGLLAAFLGLASAYGKFFDFPNKAEMFAKLGWATDVMFYVGIVEVVIAILFLIPRTAFVAAILITAYLGGATAAHVRINDPFFFPIVMGVLLWVALGLRDQRIFSILLGRILFIALCFVLASNSRSVCAIEKSPNGLSVATFDVDATPPVGFMMAYDRVKRIDEIGLRCRGIVILGAGEPIVLCAVDWIGIANESQDIFRERIGKAAGTSPSRVAVHTLHQHDAPRSDFSAEALLHQIGASELGAHNGSFAREVLNRLTREIETSIANATPITHAGFGSAKVKDVASNRRIQDETGKVVATRYTATRDEKMRALPDGIIDPELSSLSFWNGEKPVAVLSYYACHPQSYYRTGIPSPDFPGIARFMRSQDAPGPLYVHFNGAGGNIGAGKYNDGSKENRLLLGRRVADAMRESLDQTKKFSVTPAQVSWAITPVSLPPAKHLNREALTKDLRNWDGIKYWGTPDKLAWVLRCESGAKIDLGCLSIGDVRVLHMPGELFVEYQLAAKALAPDLNVAMAAYGDYGPGYIGTAEAYGQGGYETSEPASNVGPETEAILMNGIRTLLQISEATK